MWIHFDVKPYITIDNHIFPCIVMYYRVYPCNTMYCLSWWWGELADVQNNNRVSLRFCIIIESNSQMTFFAIVLYTNMAAVLSGANEKYLAIPGYLLQLFHALDSFSLDIRWYIANEARSADWAIIISNPTSASGIIVVLKNAPKILDKPSRLCYFILGHIP